MNIVPALDLRREAEQPDRGMPCNLEAEQALLGILMYDNAVFERMPDALRQASFYEPFHARLFGVLEGCIRRGHLAEPILIADELEGDAAFAEMGGLRYLADLVDRAPPAPNAVDYARVILDMALKRELIRYGEQVSAEARAGDGKAVLEAAESELFGLAEVREQGKGFVDFGEALDAALEQASEAYQREGKLVGLSTGLVDLDAKLGGLAPTNLIILAGRPSMGKTSLCTNIAWNLARAYAYTTDEHGQRHTTAGGRVAFFSLEMSKEELSHRILADFTGISSDRIRKGEIDQAEFGRLYDAKEEIRSAPLYIDPTGGISIARLCARARRLHRRVGLDLIVVDYLQLITVDGGGKAESRVLEVGFITQALKALAKELGIPVIALSQLSREVEKRPDKKPQLSDLRDSGSIEQDADAVLFVYRESYYLGRAEPDKGDQIKHMEWQEKMDRLAGMAEVIIGKQRHGPIGTVKLSFNEELTKFGNLAREGRFTGSYEQGRMLFGDDR